MMKHVCDNVKLSCGLGAVLSAFLIACCGCFSSTRYTATLHPNHVKPTSHITGRYRVAKVLVNELEIIKFVRLAMENGWLGSPDGYNKFNSYAEKNGIDVLPEITDPAMKEHLDGCGVNLCNRTDEFVVYSHYECYRASGYAGDDVCCAHACSLDADAYISLDVHFQFIFFRNPVMAAKILRASDRSSAVWLPEMIMSYG